MITVTADGKVAQADKPKFIIELARENGTDIPNLCHDKSLDVVSAYRPCLVGIEGNKKLTTTYSTLTEDNMVIHTKADRLIKHRQRVLQMLLDSHPNDCLTCQKSGECQLRECSYEYDVKFREHDGARREKLVDDSLPYIVKDNGRCILCGKCVRTCSVMDDRKALNFSNRGYETRINLDINNAFESSYHISCNRCVITCPIGALMDERAIDLGGKWELKTKKVQCKVCEYGYEFEALRESGKNIVLRALSPENGKPFCLKGRLTTELLSVDNPKQPYKKIGSEFVKASWSNVLGLDKILKKVEKIDDK